MIQYYYKFKKGGCALDENSTKKAPYAALCAVACVLILLIPTALRSASLSILKIIVIPLFACVFSVILGSDSPSYSFIAAIFGVASTVMSYFLTGGDPLFLSAVADVLFAFVLGIALRILCKKKAQKSVTFAVSSFISAIYTFAVICIAVYAAAGSFSLSAIGESVDKIAENFSGAYYEILSGAAQQTPYAAEIDSAIQYVAESIEYSIKLYFPSLIAYYAMALGGITVLLYRPLLRITHLEEKCLSERSWRFRLSGVSVAMFYLSYVAYLIVMFFFNNTVLTGALLNLTQIITVPFMVRGIVFLYEKLSEKLKGKAAPVVIIAASSLGAALLLGADAVMIILACAGAYSESRRALGKN